MKSLSLAAALTVVKLVSAIFNDATVTDSIQTCLGNCTQTFCVEMWPQVGCIFGF